MNKAVFLTRGEITILSDYSLSIHLKPNDLRVGKINNLLEKNKLVIVTVDPDTDKFYKIHKGNWYAIPSLEYTGKANYSNYIHFSLNYNFKDPNLRILKDKEIETFRKKQLVDLHDDRNTYD